jgi:hypothetical protein
MSARPNNPAARRAITLQATQGKARECSNRNEILQSDLTIRFQARDIFGGIQNLNAHNASVRSRVEGNCFAERAGGHFSRIVAQTNVESIYFGIICYFHRFPSLLKIKCVNGHHNKRLWFFDNNRQHLFIGIVSATP